VECPCCTRSRVAHMYELIAMALGARHNGAAIANCRDIRAARLKAIKADILENIGDELTVTAVALRHGITPRYIHMLFEMEGVTFSQYVLGQRLMRAYGMISDPRFAGLNITSIAFASGFGDLSYFNRTFRRRFGTTPYELRKTVYQDERTSRPVGRRLPTRRGEGQEISLHGFQECQLTVSRDFWAKLKRFAGQVPFVEDLVTGYYTAMDTVSPMRVRGMLLAALAYFIVPFDLIPDTTPGLGFTDDLALLVAVMGRVSSHITPVHRAAAARALGRKLPPTG
jgi:uncharacterized membrane protein YkvA (DUF1232 family)/AraC-like DNA-binding protein